MTEMFVAFSDALARTAAPVFSVQHPGDRRLRRPFYLPEPPAQTPAEYAGALAKLGRLGIVRAN